MKFIIRKNKGFTLVEMMVAVSIFVIVALIISGAYITLADIFRKIQSNRAVIDNLNFAMDTMTLQIREGIDHDFSDSCGDLCYHSITFTELSSTGNGEIIESRQITYKLDSINQAISQKTKNLLNDNEDNFNLTSPEIKVKNLRFFLKGSIPERILISIDGIAKNKEKLESEFTLQTTLAQRNTN